MQLITQLDDVRVGDIVRAKRYDGWWYLVVGRPQLSHPMFERGHERIIAETILLVNGTFTSLKGTNLVGMYVASRASDSDENIGE